MIIENCLRAGGILDMIGNFLIDLIGNVWILYKITIDLPLHIPVRVKTKNRCKSEIISEMYFIDNSLLGLFIMWSTEDIELFSNFHWCAHYIKFCLSFFRLNFLHDILFTVVKFWYFKLHSVQQMSLIIIS